MAVHVDRGGDDHLRDTGKTVLGQLSVIYFLFFYMSFTGSFYLSSLRV